MGENFETGGESLANRVPVELVNALEENNSAIESNAETPSQENESKEIHHHTHHAIKKNWKIYLWDFIMLFLAVFCGFLAENQREYMVERKREKQYIQTLIKDVQTDTANITKCITAYLLSKNRIDTIFNNFERFTKDFSALEGRNYFSLVYTFAGFIYTDRTMQQLKNAGGLRLVKAVVSDSIIAYDSEVKYMFSQINYNENVYVQLIDLTNKMVSYRNALAENKTRYLDNLTTGKAGTWIKHDPVLFEELYNLLFLYYLTNDYSIVRLNKLKIKGSQLISFLKTEYHLE